MVGLIVRHDIHNVGAKHGRMKMVGAEPVSQPHLFAEL